MFFCLSALQQSDSDTHTYTCPCILSCFSHIRLCDSTDCSMTDSTVHWILRARKLEWVAMLISRKESESEVAQSCPTLCDPTDCSLPGSSVHGIFQARVLEWVAFPSPGNLPDPGVEPRSPTLQADALTSEPPGLALCITK